MRNRFKKYILYKFIQYIPGASKIAKEESRKLAKYVFDNFSETDRLLIMTEMRQHLIDLINQQVTVKENDINRQLLELEYIKLNLNKLNSK